MKFNCLFLGSALLTDATDRHTLKMAARAVLADDARIVREGFVVDLMLTNRELNMICHRAQTAAVSAEFEHISACFIVRENPRVVSLAITEHSLNYALVFLMATPHEADSLVAAIVDKFGREALDGDAQREAAAAAAAAFNAF